MKLETDRLVLRQMTEKDVKDIVRNINNLNVSRWLAVVPYPYCKKDAINWIKKGKEYAKQKPRSKYPFGIELKEEGKIIGGIGIHDINFDVSKAEIGYWLGQKYWGKGYGGEALRTVLDFAFNKLKLKRLEAKVYEGNERSAGLLEKFGFKKEGFLRESCRSKADKKIHSEYVYGLLKREYKRRK